MKASFASITGPLVAAVTLAATTACAAEAQQTSPAAAPATAAAPVVNDEVVLLGTGGGPIARISRSQPANLLQVGGKTYLIDIGDGTARQIVRSGRTLTSIDAVFITHLHFDHTAGTMGFLALDWPARRRRPVTFYGPPGTDQFVQRTLTALSSGEAIFRPELPDLGPMASVFKGQDFDVTTPREVYHDDHVTVTAVENSHYATMHLPVSDHGTDRSYSYRFDMADRSIVFTGDTGPSEAVIKLAKGADVLVSEVIDLPGVLDSLRKRGALTAVNQQPLIDHMEHEHLTPENVGKLAAAAGVREVVLTHFGTSPGDETTRRAYILSEIRKAYAGPVIFGEDLMTF
ncbi:MAG: MBL fold metallo-hydrolase [Sphingomonadales bacterium]|nr:MBL fold metallo-hydrolase [Sphingomonadales bacterium]MDE2568438.1 MBL fold metallo-hydrolase [Sphingomonadales bacterium]